MAEGEKAGGTILDAGLATKEVAFDWKSQIPSEFKDEPTLQQIKDLPTLVKNYVHAEKKIGKSIRIPDADSSEQERQDFLKKLGRPESSEKYTSLDTSTLPKDLNVDGEFIKNFRNAAFENGLTDAQQKSILQHFFKHEISTMEADAAAEEKGLAEIEQGLRKRFGPAYDERMALAQRAYKTLVPDDLKSHFRKEGLENDPALVVLFANMGARMIEDRSIDGSGGVGSLIMTPEEALERIDEIRRDPNHSYQAKFAGTPEHQRAVEQMDGLYKLAYPGAK